MQCTYCVPIILQNTFAAVEVGYGIWDRFGGMGKFKGKVKV